MANSEERHVAIEVEQSIRDAIIKEGQPAHVADRIMAWLNSLAAGEESASQKDEVTRRLQDIYSILNVGDDES